MADSIPLMHRPLALALALIYIFLSACGVGKAQKYDTPQTAAAGVLGNEYFPGAGGSHQDQTETGSINTNLDHKFTQVLLCFNEKQIYCSCSEAYRVSQSGDLHVPPQDTDEYCNGPCLSETQLVLDCIESVESDFKFDNKATIKDVKETIKDGCSLGPWRGDFNVAVHVQKSNAHKDSSLFLHGLLLLIIIMGFRLFPSL